MIMNLPKMSNNNKECRKSVIFKNGGGGSVVTGAVSLPQQQTSKGAQKNGVRQRFMKKIIKTTINLSDRRSRQQQQQQEAALSSAQQQLSRIVDVNEIAIPTNGMLISKRVKEEEEQKLKTKMTTILGESPQEFLDNALKARGYPVTRYNTLESAYYNEQPTVLQQASYGVRLLQLIDQSNEEGLESCLLAGIHSNPCDEYGESILHRVCRDGNMALLDIMLDNDCNVQCADDFGRTPLHEACRCEHLCLEVVETLMMQDIHLLYMADANGVLPLEYTNPEHWYDWMLFLEPRLDRFWPSLHRPGREEQKTDSVQSSQPPLTLKAPGSRPAADPDSPLTTELAWMVASGVIEPEEAVSYMDENVLKRFLPTIHQRLNDMAIEEEMKEKRHQQRKLSGDVDSALNDDLTV